MTPPFRNPTQPVEGKLLVGLYGRARAGKDTAAAFLEDRHLLQQFAFANPLKGMLTSVFGDLFYDGDREKPIEWLGKSPRQLMQTLGTEWGRQCVHPDLWVLLAHQEWLACQRNLSKGMVVSDVRFDNEARWIKEQGGTLIEIRRHSAGQVANHTSEAGITVAVDHVIRNDGTIDDLYAALDEVMSWLPT